MNAEGRMFNVGSGRTSIWSAYDLSSLSFFNFLSRVRENGWTGQKRKKARKKAVTSHAHSKEVNAVARSCDLTSTKHVPAPGSNGAGDAMKK